MNLTKKRIKYIIDNITASLGFEGCKVSDEAVTINRHFLEGRISSKEAVRRIKEKYKKYIGGK